MWRCIVGDELVCLVAVIIIRCLYVHIALLIFYMIFLTDDR